MFIDPHPHSTIFFQSDELKRNYQELQETSQEDINLISSKIKNAIDLAKPFYEARRQAGVLMKDLKVDQSNYERAKTNLAAAKEMVFLAEQSVTQVRRRKFFRCVEIELLNIIFLECARRMWVGYSASGNDQPRNKPS